MTFRKTKGLFAVAVFIWMLPTQAPAQNMPNDWTVYSNPTPAEIKCASYSDRAWTVSLENGTIQVVPFLGEVQIQQSLPFKIEAEADATDIQGTRSILQVDDGWLVGFDAGEFGGSLWWFNKDGKNRLKIADENVVGFTRLSGDIVALVGLAHLGFDFGKVLRIDRHETGRWQADKLADLGGAPRAFVLESDQSLLVITTNEFVRVRLTGTVDKLYRTNYRFLYPNSIVLTETGIVYVGMRHFITRVTPTPSGYKEEWFVPTNCRHFQLEDYECLCL